MMKDKIAKQELIDRLNTMYEEFWNSFEIKYLNYYC